MSESKNLQNIEMKGRTAVSLGTISQLAVEPPNLSTARGIFGDLNALLKLMLIYHHSKNCQGSDSESDDQGGHRCSIPYDCLSMKLWLYHEMVCSNGSQDCEQCRFIEVLKGTSSLFLLLIRSRNLHSPTKEQLLELLKEISMVQYPGATSPTIVNVTDVDVEASMPAKPSLPTQQLSPQPSESAQSKQRKKRGPYECGHCHQLKIPGVHVCERYPRLRKIRGQNTSSTIDSTSCSAPNSPRGNKRVKYEDSQGDVESVASVDGNDNRYHFTGLNLLGAYNPADEESFL